MSLSAETRTKIAAAWSAILDAAAEATMTLEEAAQRLAQVGIRSVQRYARETKGAREELDAALCDGAELMVSRIPSLIIQTPDARRARVLADYTWKLAASRDPRFRDRTTHDVNLSQRVDLTVIIAAANARLAAARAPAIELKPDAQGTYQPPAELSALL